MKILDAFKKRLLTFVIGLHHDLSTLEIYYSPQAIGIGEYISMVDKS